MRTSLGKYEKKPWLFEELVLKSWWMILFIFLSLFAYEQASQRREQEEMKLEHKLHTIQRAIDLARSKFDELQREADSMDDESSLELILMQKMGLVPEGQIKVFFK